MKIMMIILDGLGDRPIKEFNMMTPLEYAETPVMDELSNRGINGIIDPISPGIRPGSAPAHLSLFGYNPYDDNMGRGPFEALGLGEKLEHNDIAIRCNFATLNDEGTIIDRRAGRSIIGLYEIINSLNELDIGIKFRFVHNPLLYHRAVLILKEKDLSDKISGSDPNKNNSKPLKIKPLDEEKETIRTAKLLEELQVNANKILKNHPSNELRKKNGIPIVNTILTRGAGRIKKLETFENRYSLKAACVAGGILYKGVSRALEFDVKDVPKATASTDTDVNAKIKIAINSLKKYDFVYLHFKGTDVAGENGDFMEKKRFIEKVDSEMIPLLELSDNLIVITGDHATPSSIKTHSGDPVPICINGPPILQDNIAKFSERSAAHGGLGRISGKNLMPILIDLINYAHKVD